MATVALAQVPCAHIRTGKDHLHVQEPKSKRIVIPRFLVVPHEVAMSSICWTSMYVIVVDLCAALFNKHESGREVSVIFL